MAWKVLFPFSAMRQSASLMKKEAQRTKDNVEALKILGKGARDAVVGPTPDRRRDEAFADAIARRGEDAMSLDQLRRHFLLRKRIALFVAAVFGASSVSQILLGLWDHSTRNVLMGVLSAVGGQPMFFVVALGAQLRIWQIDTRRLSSSERGGLGDYMREHKRWWLEALNPELQRAKERTYET